MYGWNCHRSHSEKLAQGVIELCRMMAADCPLAAAGGNDNGSLGTSYVKIKNAIESVHGEDGVVVLMDMGSAVMTTEMALEELGFNDVVMVDCPIVEGAVTASLSSVCGDSLEQVRLQASSSKGTSKIQ